MFAFYLTYYYIKCLFYNVYNGKTLDSQISLRSTPYVLIVSYMSTLLLHSIIDFIHFVSSLCTNNFRLFIRMPNFYTISVIFIFTLII